MSARKTVLDTLRASTKKVGNAGYFVKRGAINWTTFDFTAHARAISIQVDNYGFLKVNGVKEATLTLEMFARMPEQPEGALPEIDDALLDEMIEDAEKIVADLRAAQDKQQDAVVMKIDPASANITEAHDVALRVQGVVVTIVVNF